MYGYIIALNAIRPASSPTAHLFVATDRYQYFTCSWDAEAKELKTEQSYVDTADKTLRDTRENDRVHIDPTRRYMTLELYDGTITVLPLVQPSTKKMRRDSSAKSSNVPGSLGEPVPVRVDEIAIRASTFAHADEESKENPRLALLWEDNQGDPYLKTLELKYTTAADQGHADLTTKDELRADLDKGVSHLIPVPLPVGGFLILGERSIAYTDSTLTQLHLQSLEDQATVWSCWAQVDDLRWLLADDYGNLYFLMLVTRDGSLVKSWRLDYLGKASKASCLVYIDEGVVFVGSHSGDSQLVQVHEGGVDVLQTLPNIAPILDLQLMDLGRGAESQTGEYSAGQARIVTTSGAWEDGSIRSVRSGVGMEEIGAIGDIPLITDLWALSTTGHGSQHDALLASFATETRVFKFDADAAVEEVDDFSNIDFSKPTLLAANLPDNKLLQVHDSGLRISDLESGMSVFQWSPTDSGAKITGACANGAHIIAVESGRIVHVFHTLGQDVSPTASKTFAADSQISSVAVSDSHSNACVVSFWQTASLALLDLHSLETILTHSLGDPGSDVPRSILIANVLPGAAPTLFVSMADGTVVTFSFDTTNLTLTGMNRILLGSEPVFLKPLPRTLSDGQEIVNVFASCEQPSLIYASEGRMLYSAINSDQAARVCPFNSEAYPGAIAVASPDDLKLAIVDTTRTTQLQTLPVGETVRCIQYQPKLKMFGVGCVNRLMEVDGDQPREELRSSVKLADEVTFKEIHSISLGDREMVECITTFEQPAKGDNDDDTSMEDDSHLFVVGTSISPEANAINQEDKGRILVFEVNSRKRELTKLTELELRGACRNIAVADGFIVAGLVKVVALYALAPSTGKYSCSLRRLASYRTSTDPMSLSIQPATASRPTTIAVGDLVKSVSIVTVSTPQDNEDDDGEWQINELARHYATLWTSAVAAVGEGEWTVADMEGNIAMLRQNPDAYGDEKKRLEVSGEMRLCEIVNKIIPITSSSSGTGQKKDSVSKGKRRTSSMASAAVSREAAIPSSLTDDFGPLVRPQAFVGTQEGSIYLLGAINASLTDAMIRLQTALSTRILSPGYMPWAKFRAWKTEVREADEPFRFVDGEMVEQGLLKLDDGVLEDVLRESGLGENGLTVARLRSWGEELRRLY